MGALRFEILGPLRVWRDGVELNAGPHQQALLLALLLARDGRPTSTSELVDLIWGEAVPNSAVNVLHKYVGNLRRLLEPDLPARSAGSFLLRRGNGYLFATGSGWLDLTEFRERVAAAVAAGSTHRRDSVLRHYSAALNLWTAPAGDGVTSGPAAAAVFTGLTNEFLDTCTAATELAVSMGRSAELLGPLQLAAAMAPLHEPVQASLVTALGAAGRQADALSVFHAVRRRLTEEIGVDPGHALNAAHRRVLNPTANAGRRADAAASTTTGLVGRADELAVMRRAVEPVFAGASALVIVEGEPGVGKTRLLEEAAAEADQRGARTVWGRCLPGDGTPSMWPWVQAARAVLAAQPVGDQEAWLDGDLGRLLEPRDGTPAGQVLPDSGGQFRLFERVVELTGQVSRNRPLVLVIDDLHWADVASLQLFGHLAARLPTGTVLVGALRDTAPPPGTELSRMLAAASRVPGHRRIRIGPLDPDEVAELVRLETGIEPDRDAARNIFARTEGNPFFVRELSRFLADTNGLGSGTDPVGVPATVVDVVRDRLGDIDTSAAGLVHAAALAGREVTIGLLASVAGVDARTCLELLEPLQGLGVLVSEVGDPHTLRFTHDLVREAVVGTTPPGRANQLHVRIADAIEGADAHDESRAERVAYHLWSAGPLAEPTRTAEALMRAGSRAATKSALAAAEGHLRSAVRISRDAGLAELELAALSQLTAVVGMRQMYGTAALELLERAERLARALDRDLEATGFLFSRWTAHGQAVEFDRSGALARRLLEQGYASDDETMRTYGVQAWGIHQYHMGNVGEAFRYVSQSEHTLLGGLTRHGQDPVRGDLELLMTGMLAEITAVHGDVASARRLLDTLEVAAGESPYRITVWSTMVSRVAAVIGDPQLALRAAERGIAVDPGFSFVFLGTYQRLARCWALAITRADRDAIGEARRLITANLLNPPRSCVATWYALLGEMLMAVDQIDDADVALNRAQWCLDAYGQRYPEGLLGVLRARVMQARGEPTSAVRSVALAARTLSAQREAGLFVARADRLLDELS